MTLTVEERPAGVGFAYVIDKSVKSPICFGSTLPREVLPKKGPQLTTFMARSGASAGGAPPFGGHCYEQAKRPRNIKAWTISRTPRWHTIKTYEPPPRPRAPPKRPKSSQAPFGASSRRFRTEQNANPGPGTYNPSNKKRHVKFYYSFGGKRSIVPSVRIKCVPNNEDACASCGAVCGPLGDYWCRQETNDATKVTFLCRPCMADQYKRPKRRRRFPPDEFELIRDCRFAHHHESFENAIKLKTRREIAKKIYIESYLSQYFSSVFENKFT